MKNSILIIGAGAAGSMAAYLLSKAGKNVTLLEARNRAGGRIYTLNDISFFNHTELGAEFIHGDLPVTINLLKEAGISYRSANAEMWQFRNNCFEANSMVINDWDKLLEKLNELKQDTNIYDFLLKEFPGIKYEELRDSVWKYVSGYDTADPRQASAFALRKEWQNEEPDTQHRVNGGYGAVITFLLNQCKANGGEVFFNTVAKEIKWQDGKVSVFTTDGKAYEAEILIIAIPLGVLQAKHSHTATVTFNPPVPEHLFALKQIGFGSVIKVLFEFKRSFWLDTKIQETTNHNINAMGYLFSDQEIPTWWTQVPDNSNVLTGWIGGPAAHSKLNLTDSDIALQGLQSLSVIFKCTVQELKGELIASRIMNWTADPFTLGSYAYDMINSADARKVLNTPVSHTLYFTGEYLYEGAAMGTVEAALSSATYVANKILGNK
ncbi:flavin monoamine oxidase family protein [Mucilaginibacter segetis]|uniref:Tryptophan 2-monooxygenase n=1 Tax=Mucilaginibacter segetis TaxID=2793071 RepID=A0A934PXW1_9SPHI|nr:NAD(P)/FAD-dependent oxidoreductase [Mucilaginibacter segetis]MBK0381028.1 FAD-dependent oxidoreductase [Mucilaginibacter segetis]